MSSKKTKQAWEPSDDLVERAIDAYEHAPGVRQEPAMRAAILAAVAADPLLSAAKDMQDALADILESPSIKEALRMLDNAFGTKMPDAAFIRARNALLKSRGEC